MVPQEPHHDQYGYITTLATAEIGVPPVELRNLAARGALRHVRRGVYRFEDARRTAQARLGGDEVPHRVREIPYHQGHRGLTEPSTVRGQAQKAVTRPQRPTPAQRRSRAFLREATKPLRGHL